MRRHVIGAAALATVGLGLGTSTAAAGPPQPADHGHILLLDVQTVPGSNPPVPTSVRKCVDLAAGQPVGTVGRDDPRHIDFDGGWFTARSTHVVVPTYPYAPPILPDGSPNDAGEQVPWHNCDDFLSMFGIG